MNNVKKEISNLYASFFRDLNIDDKTGLIQGSNLKFATYPYIGLNYGSSKKKILFVGLDIGKDETIGYIQGFEERCDSIAKDSGFNPHIAGTYSTALYLLKDAYGWEEAWQRVKSYSTSQRATKISNHINNQNPLHFIALTNYYKFVDDKRINRSGDLNRKYSNELFEKKLFISEVQILNPDVIIFQGSLPIKDVILELKSICNNIFKARHPSNRKKGGRQPQNYVDAIIKL